MVNRSNKRSQPDAGPDLPDPGDFVEQYCQRRNLVVESLVGTSEIEKSCIRSAEEARQLYKDHRDDELERRGQPVPRTESNQSPGTQAGALPPVTLSPAQKYSRRLFNNRKSAAAAKVYQDVLRRELATAIQSIPLQTQTNGTPRGDVSKANARLEAERLQLQISNSELRQRAEAAERCKVALEKENQQLKAKVIAWKSAQGAVTVWERQQHYPRKDILKIMEDSQQPLAATSQEMDLVQQMSSQTHMPNSQQLLNNVGTRQASQTRATTGTVASSGLRFSSEFALSPVNAGGTPGEFRTGLTCTQSQKGDDSEDLLDRSSHPMSVGPLQGPGPLPLNLGSQSQDLPSMKIGSEENPLGDDSFYLNSQGSKGS